MRRALSESDRRALLLGFAAVLSLWTVLRGAPWLIRSTAEAREDVRVLRTSLGRYERLRNAARQTSTDTARAAEEFVFAASSSGALASALTASLGEAAESAHVSLGALRADLPDSASASLSRVVATLNGDCDVEGCAVLLALLEQHRPSIRVARLRIVAGDVTGASATAERLQFEIVADALGRLVTEP